jgi:hypothetical protein
MSVAKTGMFDSKMFDGMMEMMMMIVMLAIILPQVLANKSVQSAAIESTGQTDTRKPNGDATLRWIDLIHAWPYRPWVSAIFQNTGPNQIEIGINSPNNRFILYPNSPATVNAGDDMAKNGIAIIFYVCGFGDTANLVITGTF